MFTKVLIANRGAIAVRIERTLRRLGIASLAVYAESDAASLHVRGADEAVSLGDGGADATYLDVDRLLDVAARRGAEAVHPGYGFLSENAAFVERVEAAGLAFLGPTAEQIRAFGLKHRARELAVASDVPIPPGSGLLDSLDQARAAAEAIGWPVMLKSVAGGGGIGMSRCADADALAGAWERVRHLGAAHFGGAGLYLERYVERARHVEVQVFGDGRGGALALGTRDCSAQRRHQKVLEEAPAPNLSAERRAGLHAVAERLLASVHYRSAGTVEFIVDAGDGEAHFLEVNARLQVEHGVTEAVYGIDLVEWMLRQGYADRRGNGRGDAPDLELERARLVPRGHAVQVRVYAEDPGLDFRPAAGPLTDVALPRGDGLRVDGWIEAGIEISPWFDPLLVKLIAHGDTRDAALARLRDALGATRLHGIETNLAWLAGLVDAPATREARLTTRTLEELDLPSPRIDVLRPGTQTTVQDHPGRTGYWHVGVPPSGPFDARSFRLANRLLGNPADAAGLEITLEGPTLRFRVPVIAALAGAALDATIDGRDVAMGVPFRIRAGDVLAIGRVRGAGARGYLAVAGGIDCPRYLGSRSTFTLGRFGGHAGRALRAGDVLRIAGPAPAGGDAREPAIGRTATLPRFDHDWALHVTLGPQGVPDYLTASDLERFLGASWEVHYQSARTGVRLIGPRLEWARPDGGEAGLHPSNLHDNAYAFGSVDFTGDMPVILGPDGPSLGGFACPAVVVHADLWKLGQLRAGDRLRFVPVTHERAIAMERAQDAAIEGLSPDIEADGPGLVGTEATDGSASIAVRGAARTSGASGEDAVLAALSAAEVGDRVAYRAAGDRFVLVEYGEPTLDIRLRFRAHALMQWLQAHPLPGMLELTPGIRSLQVHFDTRTLRRAALLDHLRRAEHELAARLGELRVPSRTVHLPLSWDDPACRKAVDIYARTVRPDAPWCPDNIEFIRHINGLDSIDDVKRTVLEAQYLVMGLGDVYLGAPVATPLDPRHRLVTTKYNPARTWTAENSVGIGGAYLCVYGMEGPGGYQLVGRTVQMWNRHRATAQFDEPWLLRFFDRIRFHEVDGDELARLRTDFPRGDHALDIEPGEFGLAEHDAFLARNRTGIDAFVARRDAAFAAELADWHATNRFTFEPPPAPPAAAGVAVPDGALAIDSPVAGAVWRSDVAPGDAVRAGDVLMIIESMKTEFPIEASTAGTVLDTFVAEAQRVDAGQTLLTIEPAP